MYGTTTRRSQRAFGNPPRPAILQRKDETKGKKIINWLPRKDNIPIEVLMPDKTVLKGIAEQTIAAAKESEVVQFERFGFCRLDRKGEMHSFWFTHK